MIAVLLAAAAAAAPALFRCGAVERPGIAERGEDGIWRGMAIDLCRQAAHGSAIAFRPYRQPDDLRDAARDQFAVLSHAELAVASPGSGAPAAPVAMNRQVLLVRPGSPLHDRADLAGHRVCFLIATAGEAALNAWARPVKLAIQRVGFQEPVELRDAFDFGYCRAMAVDAQDVPGGPEHTSQLGPPLAEIALFAVRMSGRQLIPDLDDPDP